MVGGVLTGRGADVILIDDPLKPADAMSESRRTGANAWFDGTLYSRLNDKTKGSIVIVMQRLHEDDLVGHVLKAEGWEIVAFPAIEEAGETHEIETPFGRKAFAREAGEALRAERELPGDAGAHPGLRSAKRTSPASISSGPRRRAGA